jgi:hypothetical protein
MEFIPFDRETTQTLLISCKINSNRPNFTLESGTQPVTIDDRDGRSNRSQICDYLAKFL